MIRGLNRAILALALARGVEPHPTIVIDPGHPSEVSSGASMHNGTSEVHIALARRAATRDAAACARDIRSSLTKPAERTMVTNVERARIGNAAKATLVVRLHCDDSPDSGYAIYHPDRAATVQGRTGPSEAVMGASAAAAESLHVSMSRMLAGKLKDGGVRGDSKTAIGSKQGALTGSVFSDVPVVLIEMVTLSNARDAAFIKQPAGQSLMAQAIAQGIARYAPAANSPRVR